MSGCRNSLRSGLCLKIIRQPPSLMVMNPFWRRSTKGKRVLILSQEIQSPVLKTGCPYESQIAKVYTNQTFRRFQDEVLVMSSCFGITQAHTNGPIITYMIKEREGATNQRNARDFEVTYDKSAGEVRSSCGCFNFNGYLCRHSLCILSYNGLEEIPSQYVIARWRKDMKRTYIAEFGSNCVDITNPVQWVEHLYRNAMQVVEQGMGSKDHYNVAWQAFRESLSKVPFRTEKPD